MTLTVMLIIIGISLLGWVCEQLYIRWKKRSKRIILSKEIVAHLTGINYWAENCSYELVEIDIRTLDNYHAVKKDAKYYKKHNELYIMNMVGRLKIGGGLAAILKEQYE